MATLPRDRTSRVVLAAFAMVLVSLAMTLFWMGREAHRSEVALSRDVRTVHSARTLSQLKACLGYELRMDVGRQRGQWSGSATEAGGSKAFNSMTDIGVRLYEQGEVREAVISTREARRLRPAERAAINKCVGA